MTPELVLYLLKVLVLPAAVGMGIGIACVAPVARARARLGDARLRDEDNRSTASGVRVAQTGIGLVAPIVFVVAYWLEVGAPAIPIAERWHVLPLAAAAIAAVVIAVGWLRGSSRWWVQWSVAAAVLGGLAWRFVVFPASNPNIQAGLLGAIVVIGLLWSFVARDACSVGMALMGAIVFAGLAVLMVFANFPSLAIITGAVAAALALVGVSSGFFNLRASARVVGEATSDGSACPGSAPCDLVPWSATGATGLAALACVLALCGHAYNYGEVRPLHWAVVLIAPFFALLVCKPCLKGAQPLVGVAWRAGLCLVVVTATVFNAMGDADDQGQDPMMDMTEAQE